MSIHITGPRDMAPKPREKLAQRPGYGTVGRVIDLETNFFKMEVRSELVVSQYAVCVYTVKRVGENVSWVDVSNSARITFNRGVFDAVMEKYGAELGVQLAYDGRSIAYAAREVKRDCLEKHLEVIVNRDGGRPSATEIEKHRTKDVFMMLQHAKYLHFDAIKNGDVTDVKRGPFLTALDVAIAANPVKKFVQVGRSFFGPKDAKPLGRSNVTASAWRGFYQSARKGNAGLLLNLDESYTAFWNCGGMLYDLVRALNNGKELPRDREGLKKIAKKLNKLRVRAVHNDIVYQVHGFSARGANELMFKPQDSNEEISVAEYFATEYQTRLEFPNRPCVKTHAMKDTYLPMEQLRVVERQRMSGELSSDQTTSIVRIASSKPPQRRQAAVQTMQQLDHSNDSVCQDFGLQVCPELVTVKARILPLPEINYRNGTDRPTGGAWRGPNNRFRHSVPLLHWCIINMGNDWLSNEEVQNFAKKFCMEAGKAGLQVQNSPETYRVGRGQIEEKMRYIMDRRKQLQMMLIVMERNDSVTYNRIKIVGDLDLGIVTQCCLQKHLKNRKGLSAYCSNLTLKINAKMGGKNCMVSGNKEYKSLMNGTFLFGPHIVLGADVTHPLAGTKRPSVAALVGSRDAEMTQFTGAVRNQTGKKEVIDNLSDMFLEVYKRWVSAHNGQVNAKAIIMFRDGVSEGQYEEVMDVEVAALRKACTLYDESFKPNITYIIVTKRHHARFFAKDSFGDRNGNLLAGTVIEREITSEDYYEFYLNSHAGIQGTNRPSRYTVLVDDNKLSPDQLQGYVFNLAHGFVRCNRSVSMVNSAYYAHLLAFRGRAYLPKDDDIPDDTVPPSPILRNPTGDRMFFV